MRLCRCRTSTRRTLLWPLSKASAVGGLACLAGAALIGAESARVDLQARQLLTATFRTTEFTRKLREIVYGRGFCPGGFLRCGQSNRIVEAKAGKAKCLRTEADEARIKLSFFFLACDRFPWWVQENGERAGKWKRDSRRSAEQRSDPKKRCIRD